MQKRSSEAERAGLAVRPPPVEVASRLRAVESPFLLRYRYADGRIQAALPLHEVERTPTRTVGWLLAGSDISWWSTADGADPRSVPLESRFAGELFTGPRRWEGGHVLRVLPAGRPYQVIHFWRDAVFTGWYVNFESPVVWRGRIADTRDWHLDLWVMPDGTVSWKDEEEASVAARFGQVEQRELDLARQEGDRIVADVEGWLAHIGDWRSARPARTLQPLPLPPHWDATDDV